MTEHNIDLNLLKFRGHTLSEMRDGALSMTVTRANPLNHCKPGIRCVHYTEVPGRYRLPLRIDITAKIDVPSFYIMLGEGHANFGIHFDNRRLDDICEPQNKINHFNSRIPMNEFADITLIYDLKEMQIIIDGEERYYSKREKYMKSPVFKGMNEEGFPLRISCVKRTNLEIRSIRITEYDDTAGINHIHDPKDDKFVPPTEKPTFESCLSGLPDDLRTAIIDIDGWLRTLRPMKFKRQISKYGDKITYTASEQGFSYAIHISGNVLYHTLQWYILTQGKPETWGRKADRMEDTLNYLAQTEPAFARRMWGNLYECVGGYGPGCMAKTPYTFASEKITACHGKMYFNMNLSEFEDVKHFIGAVNEITSMGGFPK
ncbi:MAG: hypothetical protein A2Y17_04980 [Clostridiales bacterium GWF2_38_85]|nr:MAG: hypothetical protein A2Y17_04980 [Clostridiales bacterium GWF2_38_85]HBL84357.1 hypothetical protein [Clostridiales bacterium]